MRNFAFIIHPIDPKRDVSRKFPLLGKVLSEQWIHFFSTYFPPVYISKIEGIRSTHTGEKIGGWFVACPYTPQKMLDLPVKTVYGKVIQTGKMAQKLGANLLGLGAFTSVVGDGGITIRKGLQIPVTTGDSYTVSVGVDAAIAGARQLGKVVPLAVGAVVGASGSIGSVSARLLARQVASLWLFGKREQPLLALKTIIEQETPTTQVQIATDLQALSHCDIVITVTNAIETVIEPHHLKCGAVVCDVARPRDVSTAVAKQRPDVLVIDGGMVKIPGDVNFNFNFGFPPTMAYACMAETIALTLENRLEDFTLGKEISLAKVEEIARIAEKHGLHLGGFRSFEKPVSDQHLQHLREMLSNVSVYP
jgi:predicted amino acid dehydrogenase